MTVAWIGLGLAGLLVLLLVVGILLPQRRFRRPSGGCGAPQRLNPGVEAIRAAMGKGTRTRIEGDKVTIRPMTEREYQMAAQRLARVFGGGKQGRAGR